MRIFLFFLLFCIGGIQNLKSQIVEDVMGDEGAFYSETKQVNQFFRRFNNEEGLNGVRYIKTDSEYRNPKTRVKYLNMLFDSRNNSLSEKLREEFKNDVLNKADSHYLDFRAKGWFAEVKTRFLYNNEEKNVTIFLELEHENKGFKWVITNVFFEDFAKILFDQKSDSSRFLHPLSHEIDFMNLVKVFNDQDYIDNYTVKNFDADFLTLFLYEYKKGNFEFKYVEKLKFHFFQIPNWYFEIEQFVRPDFNSGWLISKLTKISKHEKSILLNYIYRN